MTTHKGMFRTRLNEYVIYMMNTYFNRVYWPILAFFIWKEKTTKVFDGITNKDFREESFHNDVIKLHIKTLINARVPLISEKTSLMLPTKYSLTPIGRKLAETQWSILNNFTKMLQEKTIEDQTKEILANLDIKIAVDEEDEEERLLREVEENNRIAEELKRKRLGIVETPNGPVIDLAKVKA